MEYLVLEDDTRIQKADTNSSGKVLLSYLVIFQLGGWCHKEQYLTTIIWPIWCDTTGYLSSLTSVRKGPG